MKKMGHLWLLFVALPILAMEKKPYQKHFFESAARLAYAKKQQTNTANPTPRPACWFCDKKNMEENNYVLENGIEQDNDTWVILNKNPYAADIYHILIIPQAHEEKLEEMSQEQAHVLTNTLYHVLHRLKYDGYRLFVGINDSPAVGGSVPHFHWQVIATKQAPLEMPLLLQAEPKAADAQKMFQALQSIWQYAYNADVDEPILLTGQQCECCAVIQSHKDEPIHNLLLYAGDNNCICYAKYPEKPGQLCIVPKPHVVSIRDIDADTFNENIQLTRTVLPMIKKIANEKIRGVVGANFSLWLAGDENKDEDKQHMCSTITVRTELKSGCVDYAYDGFYSPYANKHVADALRDALNNSGSQDQQ